MTIIVANRRYYATVGNERIPTRFYVGRPSPLGNQYKIGRDGDRAGVIALYARWLDWALKDPESGAAKLYARLLATARRGDLTLICWCAPEPCHADVLKERLDGDLFAARYPTPDPRRAHRWHVPCYLCGQPVQIDANTECGPPKSMTAYCEACHHEEEWGLDWEYNIYPTAPRPPDKP